MLRSPTQFLPLPTFQKDDEVELFVAVFREHKSTLAAGLRGKILDVCDGQKEYVVEFTQPEGSRETARVRGQWLRLYRRAGETLVPDDAAAKGNGVIEAVVAILRTNRALVQVGHLSLAQVDAVLEQVEQRVREARLALREQSGFRGRG